MDNEKIGNFISELRKEKNMTQEELANLIPISRQAVSKWERGQSLPDSVSLFRLSKIFGISISEILSGKKFDKSIDDDITINLYNDRNKKFRTIKILIVIILLLVMSFLIYYFINTFFMLLL